MLTAQLMLVEPAAAGGEAMNFQGQRLDPGRQAAEQVGSVETVNGSIHIEESVRAGDIETVSGSIDIGRDSTVGDVDTVNGSMTLEAGVKARFRRDGQRPAQARGTRAGSRQRHVGQRLADPGQGRRGQGQAGERQRRASRSRAASVGNGIKTVNGDIEIGAGSRIDGGILVEKPDASFFATSARPRSPSAPTRK